MARLPGFGDQPFAGQLATSQQAGAKPPRLSGRRAKETLGLYALRVGVVVECVSAGRREHATVNPFMAGKATSDPWSVADPVTCFATTVATAGQSLQLGKPAQGRIRPEHRILSS